MNHEPPSTALQRAQMERQLLREFQKAEKLYRRASDHHKRINKRVKGMKWKEEPDMAEELYEAAIAERTALETGDLNAPVRIAYRPVISDARVGTHSVLTL
jgi:hypothetical protein